MEQTKYIDGGTYGLCCTCGFRYRLKDLRKQWNRLMACPTCYDEYPWVLPKTNKNEDKPLPNSSPEPEDVYIDPTAITDTSLLH